MLANKFHTTVPSTSLEILTRFGCTIGATHHHVPKAQAEDAARMLVALVFGLQKARLAFFFQRRATKAVLKRVFSKYVIVDTAFTRAVVVALLSKNRSLGDATMLAIHTANNARATVYSRYDALDVLGDSKIRDEHIRRMFDQRGRLAKSLASVVV